MTTLDYPVWLRVDHWLNVLFLTLLLRSGMEILATHPKLYGHDDSKPGTEWARFTRKVMPRDRLYDTLDEEEDYHPVIALPGHAQLGIGRHWHFISVIGWILLGLSYYILLFATGQWHRYWPYSFFGSVRNAYWATALSFGIIGAIIAIHWAATSWSHHSPRSVQRVLGAVTTGARLLLLRPLNSRQNYPQSKISEQHRVNGKPPTSIGFKVMAAHNFVDWRLRVGGLVENPVTLDLAALRSLAEPETQCVMHNCVQGWTSIAEWKGLHLGRLVELVRPLPQAKYICFLSMQDNSTDEPASHGGGQFYEVIDLEFARKPQTLLAYEMNGVPLPIKHGAPLRLRVETQVGFKMTKWINQIEFVEDFAGIGFGTGGWREDRVFYDKDVEI
ncbi:oxidoreductase molybdopterin binding subunit [Mycobacterium europaeum]|uniref:Oxidoreductase molybdopterin binding subunit n=1 Tax=Mycobacterium europaeum TaxID=761804 RepID=A0A0U1DEJ5_9MYCO|nr:molybdopterin-dependent oxidoreductase [Mycobacterium europaeum]CQD12512.1 oxidoreductase molybdopterin binding subunit [Mycobacterium europaeum]